MQLPVYLVHCNWYITLPVTILSVVASYVCTTAILDAQPVLSWHLLHHLLA